MAVAPAAVGTVLLAGELSFGSVAAAEKGDPLYRITWNSCLPYVGTEFTFQDEDGVETVCTLEKMDDVRTGAQRASGAGECFSLTFSSSARGALGHKTYRVKHFEFGVFTLMITPQSESGRVRKYEAIINRVTR